MPSLSLSRSILSGTPSSSASGSGAAATVRPRVPGFELTPRLSLTVNNIFAGPVYPDSGEKVRLPVASTV